MTHHDFDPAKDTAYFQGRTCRRRGGFRNENPYLVSDYLNGCWQEGYDDADAEMPNGYRK